MLNVETSPESPAPPDTGYLSDFTPEEKSLALRVAAAHRAGALAQIPEADKLAAVPIIRRMKQARIMASLPRPAASPDDPYRPGSNPAMEENLRAMRAPAAVARNEASFKTLYPTPTPTPTPAPPPSPKAAPNPSDASVFPPGYAEAIASTPPPPPPPPPRPLGDELSSAFGSGIAQLDQGIGKLGGAIGDVIEQTGLPGSRALANQLGYGAQGGMIGHVEAPSQGTPEKPLGLGYRAARTLAGALPAVGAGIATGGLSGLAGGAAMAAGALPLSAAAAGDTAAAAKEAGNTPLEALGAGAASGIVAQVAGMAQLSSITSRMPGLKPLVDKAISNAVARYAATKGAEATALGAVGVAQQAAQDAIHVHAGIDLDAFKDFWTTQAPEAFGANALITGAFGAAHDLPKVPGAIAGAVREGALARGRLADVRDVRQAQEYARTQLPQAVNPGAERLGRLSVPPAETPVQGKPVGVDDAIAFGARVVNPEGKVYIAGPETSRGKRVFAPEGDQGRPRFASAGDLQARGWRYEPETVKAAEPSVTAEELQSKAKAQDELGLENKPATPNVAERTPDAATERLHALGREGQTRGELPTVVPETKRIDLLDSAQNPSHMRRLVRKYAADNFRDRAYDNQETGLTISVGKKGIDHATHGDRSRADYEAMMSLPEILENARPVSEPEVDRKNRAAILDVHKLFATVSTSDGDKLVKATIRRTDKGPRFYNLESIEFKDKPTGTSEKAPDGSGSSRPTVGLPDQSIGQEGDRVKGKPKNPPSPWTKKDVEQRILKAWEGSGDYHARSMQDEANADQHFSEGSGQFSFQGGMPTELKEEISHQPQLRRFIRTNDPKGRGNDYISEIGLDRYVEQLRRMGESKIEAAKDGLRNDPTDPVGQFLVALHDNMKSGKQAAKTPVDADAITPGSKFTINGHRFEVHVQDDGFRVLKDGNEFPAVPLEAFDELPVDKGSMVKGKEAPRAPEPQRTQPRQGSLMGERFEGGITGEQRGMFDRGGKPEPGRESKYPGIREGETPAEYEKRMGIADTGEIQFKDSADVDLPFSPKNPAWESDLHGLGGDDLLAEAPRPQPTMPPRRAGLVPQPERSTAKDARSTQTPENTPPAIERENASARRRGYRDGRRIKTLREIMDQLTSSLNERAMIAKLKRSVKNRASGHYKLWQGGINVEGADDVVTFAHEVGHLLHEQIFPDHRALLRAPGKRVDDVFPVAWRPELEKLGKALYPTMPKGAVKYVGEGWAEFTRMLLTDTKLAKRLAPTTYRESLGYLLEKYPETYEALTRFRRDLKYAMEAENPLAKYIKREQPTVLPRSWREIKAFASEAKSGLMTQWFDRVDRVRVMKRDLGIDGKLRPSEDPEIAARLALPRANGHYDLVINYGQWTPGDFGVVKTGPSLAEILEPMRRPADMQRWEDYMVAKRILEKRGQGFGGIFRHATDAQLQRSITEMETAYPEYKKAADQFQKLNEWLVRDYAVHYNLLSKESAEQIIAKNLHYITFKHAISRVLEDVKSGDGTGASGMADHTSGFNRFKGDSETLPSPVEAFIAHMRGVTKRAQLNDAGLKFVNLLKTDQGFGVPEMSRWIEREDVPLSHRHTPDDVYQRQMLSDLKASGVLATLPPQQAAALVQQIATLEGPTFFENQGPGHGTKNKGLVSLLREGKREWYRVNDSRLFEVLQGIGDPLNVGPVIQLFQRLAAIKIKGATALNPTFILTNMMRDFSSALIFSRSNDSLAAAGRKFAVEAQQEYRRMIRDSFRTGPTPMSQTEAMYKHAGTEMSSLWNEANRGKGQVRLRAVLGRDNLVGKIADPMNSGAQKALAAVGHFASLSPVRRLNKVVESIPRIMNAELMRAGRTDADSVNAAAMEYRDSTLDFNRGGVYTKAANRMIPFFNVAFIGTHKLGRALAESPVKTAWRMAATVLLPSLLIGYLNRDNPGYADLPSRVRDTNFMIPWRFDDPNDPKRATAFIKIPKPKEIGAIASLGERAMLQYLGTDPATGARGDPDAFHGSAATIGDALLPNFALSPFQPFMENAANYDFYWSSPIVSGRDRALPVSQQGADRASDLARMIGHWGDWAPAHIDHLITGYTAGLGRDVVRFGMDPILRTTGWADKVAGPRPATSAPTITAAQWPIVRAFLYDATRGQTESALRFDDAYARFNGDVAMYRRLASRADPTAQKQAEEYLRENERSIMIGQVLGKYHAAIQKVWKARFAIDTSVDPDAAAAEAKALEAQVHSLIKEATVEMQKMQNAGN